MGSCFSDTVGKYEIHQQARYYTGDVKEQHFDESKYKSKSSKSYAGTNTFEDIQHQNQPIKGDIYSRLGNRSLNTIRTLPNIPPPARIQDVSYGLNPYVEKEQVYNRANTDNPLRAFQQHLNSQKNNGNFPFLMTEKQQRNNNRNLQTKQQKSNKKDGVDMKVTESRYIDS